MTGSILGVPEARQEGTNRLWAMEEVDHALLVLEFPARRLPACGQ